MRQLIGIAVFILSIVPVHLGFAEKVEDAIVQGSSTIRSRNIARARSSAIEEALLKSVLLKARDLLGDDFYSRNQDVLQHLLRKKARSLVKNFRIQKEKRLEDTFLVNLSARPEEERMRSQLETWGMLYDRGRRPHLGFESIDTQGLPNSSGFSSTFLQRLIGFGYSVGKIDSSSEETVTQSYDLAFVGNLTKDAKRNLLMDLKVYLPENPGRSRQVRSKVARPKPKTSDINPEQLQAALAAVNFLGEALPLWLDKMGRGNLYRVDFKGLPSYRAYDELLNFFQSKSKGFSGAKEKRFSQGQVMFEVAFDGAPDELVRKIQSESFSSGRFALNERSGRDLVFLLK